MAYRDTGNRPIVTLDEAADYLSLDAPAVLALVGAGFLRPSGHGPSGPEFPLVDLKAFLARNAENGAGSVLALQADGADPDVLLAALDGRADEMAQRAFEIFRSVFPVAETWTVREGERFVEQAKGRFEAILAVTSQGAEVDEALVGDLQEVGAQAAWEGSPLPQVLVMLRISRDLVVQTAVELAEEGGRHWGMALSLLLTRVLPAMDRLTDALAQGYWAAVVGREEERKALFEHVVERSSDGVFELDLDGLVQYANPSLALILGRRPEHVDGSRLADLITPLEAHLTMESVFMPRDDRAPLVELTVVRHDGVRRVLAVHALPRFIDGDLVGYAGVVRDITISHDLEAEKNEFLAMVTHDLRTPLTMILGLGATLESHSDELPPERIRRMGGSIRGQAERISRLADDLFDISRLDTGALLISPRQVDLLRVVEGALNSVGDRSNVWVDIPAGVTVLGDARRLEQIVANLVENAIQHGAPPVEVSLATIGDRGAELTVVDHGPGVPPTLVPTLFNRLRTLSRPNRDRTRGTGLGLALVKGLAEAMGGRISYERGPTGGAAFRLCIPVPRSTR